MRGVWLAALVVFGAACASPVAETSSETDGPVSVTDGIDETPSTVTVAEDADGPHLAAGPKLVIALFDVGDPNPFRDELVLALEAEAAAAGLEAVATLLPLYDRGQWSAMLGDVVEPGDIVATTEAIFEPQAAQRLDDLDAAVIAMLNPEVPEHPRLIGVVAMEPLWPLMFEELDLLGASFALCIDTSSGVGLCSHHGNSDNVFGPAFWEFGAEQADLSLVAEVPYDAIISDLPVDVLMRTRAELGGRQVVIVSANPITGAENTRSPAPPQPDLAANVVDIALEHIAGTGPPVERRVLDYHMVGTATVGEPPASLELPLAFDAETSALDASCVTAQPVTINEPSVTADLDGDGQNETLVYPVAGGTMQVIDGDLASSWPTNTEPTITDLDADGVFELLTPDGVHVLDGCGLSRYDLTDIRAAFGLESGSAIPLWTGRCVELEQGLGLQLRHEAVLELRAEGWLLRAPADAESVPCADPSRFTFAVG